MRRPTEDQIMVDAGLLQSRVIVDHNLVDGFRGEESEIRGDDAVEGDPLFVDAAALDFHLRRGSPAIDAGAPLPFLTVDYDGGNRPSGAGIDIGAFEWDAGTRIEEGDASLPLKICLHQNYPNPFNPATTIEFSVPLLGHTHLIIYNAFGEIVDRLVGDELRPGSYRATWDAGDLPSGVYYYRLEAGRHSRARSMLLIR
jgi:hypothetical protein